VGGASVVRITAVGGRLILLFSLLVLLFATFAVHGTTWLSLLMQQQRNACFVVIFAMFGCPNRPRSSPGALCAAASSQRHPVVQVGGAAAPAQAVHRAQAF
jgi:hypothetical protein